jgi:hypothetical protein
MKLTKLNKAIMFINKKFVKEKSTEKRFKVNIDNI